MNTTARFRLRLYQGEAIAIGPGKVALLEAIEQAGSISGAARMLGMSYRRAWLLVEQLNMALHEPAVITATGGSGGGGASLSACGRAVISHYRRIEQIASEAAAAEIKALQALLR
jgi:molybdate transport system regulatory protein